MAETWQLGDDGGFYRDYVTVTAVNDRVTRYWLTTEDLTRLESLAALTVRMAEALEAAAIAELRAERDEATSELLEGHASALWDLDAATNRAEAAERDLAAARKALEQIAWRTPVLQEGARVAAAALRLLDGNQQDAGADS